MAAAAAPSTAERLAWLRLARTPNVGPVTFDELIRRCGSAQEAIARLPRLARRGGRIDALAIPSLDAARAELDRLESAGGVLMTARDPTFPALLRALDPPPPVISVLGDPKRLLNPCAAIVGSRNASAIARRFAHDIAAGLGAAGFVVVSGLARGIDAAAHEGALAAGTIAVVAGGVDHIYPPENAALRERIAREGAIVSERAFGQIATAKDFPRRNRLISGLSLGVVVIEAAERSGSLITARFAAEQGREVMAAPGSPLDPRTRGANRLIKEGAVLIESVEDVVDILRGVRAVSAGERDRDAWRTNPADDDELDRQADEVRDRVLELLSPSPTPRDDIVRFSGANAAAVAAALVELELAGKAESLAGGGVVLRSPDERFARD